MAAGQRLFFALWPDPAVRSDLDQLAQAAAARAAAKPTRVESLHLTLLFLGECTAPQTEALFGAVAESAVSAFDLSLDRLGCWTGNGIVWLAPRQPPQALLALQRRLRRVARAADCRLDRRPFAPHLTLARKAQRPFPEENCPPLVWRVQRFALVESVLGPAGAAYRELAGWPLTC